MNRETGDPGCVVAVPCRALHCGTEQNTLMHADAAGMRVVSSHPSLPYCYRNSRCRYAAIAASLAQTSAVGPLAAPRPLLIVQDSFSYSPTIRPLLPRARCRCLGAPSRCRRLSARIGTQAKTGDGSQAKVTPPHYAQTRARVCASVSSCLIAHPSHPCRVKLRRVRRYVAAHIYDTITYKDGCLHSTRCAFLSHYLLSNALTQKRQNRRRQIWFRPHTSIPPGHSSRGPQPTYHTTFSTFSAPRPSATGAVPPHPHDHRTNNSTSAYSARRWNTASDANDHIFHSYIARQPFVLPRHSSLVSHRQQQRHTDSAMSLQLGLLSSE